MAKYKAMGSTITDAYFVGASGTDAATCKVRVRVSVSE